MKIQLWIVGLAFVATTTGCASRGAAVVPKPTEVRADFIADLVDKKFFAPVPEVDEQAWEEFSGLAADKGKSPAEIERMKASLLTTVRDELYRQATGVGVWAPTDFDEFAADPEVVVTARILGISISGSVTNEQASTGIMDQFSSEGDVRTTSNQITVAIKLDLAKAGRRLAASDASGVGEIVLSRVAKTSASVDLTDLVGQAVDSSEDVGSSVADAAAESHYETEFLVTNGLLAAGGDAVKKAVNVLWSSYQQVYDERQRAGQ